MGQQRIERALVAVEDVQRFGAVFGGDDLVAVHGNGARHQRAHGNFIVGDQHARHRALNLLRTGSILQILPAARSRLLKKRISILRTSGGDEASRELNKASSPSLRTASSNTT